MKKLLISCLLAVASTLCAQAYDFSAANDAGKTIYYNITDDTNREVAVTYKDSNYKSYSDTVAVPSSVTYNGDTYRVTGIGERAFYNCDAMTSVTLPEGLTSIGEWAFYNCVGLTSVTLPEGVTSIENRAFYACNYLASVTLPEGLTRIGEEAFLACTALLSVTIPEEVTSIENKTFYNCTSMASVTIPEGVTSIGEWAFSGCSKLDSITVPNSVSTIGAFAFIKCSSLDYFSAGYRVDTIGTQAFSGCTGLTKYYSHSVVPPGCGGQAMDDIDKSKCTLYVPAGSIEAYKAAPQWEEFTSMEEMEPVLVAEIELNLTDTTLAPNDTVRLVAQILPENATDPTLVWSTSDESIATVDETGLVTALAGGTATITAKSQDGNAEATCTITVESVLSGIDAVFGEDTEIEVFNLHGHQVGNSTDDLPAGVYIIKEGNRTYKTVVR